MSDEIQSFVNRLNKNTRHFSKWARRQGLEAWRLYDKDIPAFPFAIDRYGDYIHLQEYDTGWEIAPEAYQQWIEQVRDSVAQVAAVPVEHVVLKSRRRQRGKTQYEKYATAEEQEIIIQEYGQRFIVNLHAYLDSGLFLDHRPTRKRVREEAAGKRFLNLFAYTGSFTVYAACGGAVSSETVDLSNTYQEWAQRNFLLNELDLGVHQLIRSDVFLYLQEAQRQRKVFDLIVMDPPTFSNSKKMRDILDVQRDHTYLIDAAMALLSPGGTLYFSTNLRRFILDDVLQQRYRVQDISAWSVPEDFRNRKIHQCFCIQPKPHG